MAGVGFNDHSSGPRTWEDFGGNYFLVAITPQWVVHAVGMWDRNGDLKLSAGSLYRDSGVENVISVLVPPLDDLQGYPRSCDIRILLEGGREIGVAANVQHAFPMTINDDNENINGADWIHGDPTFFTECPIEIYLKDGSVGYGHLERSARRSSFTRTGAM
jgi:hypothetical protein